MENEMTNDAAVAEIRLCSGGGMDGARYALLTRPDAVKQGDLLYSATTVAELRARVAELEAGARELRRAFIFRQAVVASAETPEKIDFADDKVWAAAEKVRELLEKSP